MGNEEKKMGELDAILKRAKDLQKSFGGIEKLMDMTEHLTPKDKFIGEIDGVKIEVSSGVSGRAIVIVFDKAEDQSRFYSQLKEQKKTFFQRVFNTNK